MARSRTGGIAVLLAGRFAWLLLQVVSIAVYVRVLGVEAYGVAIAVALYRGYAKLLDFEIPGGALQRLSAAFPRDEARAWRLFRTTLGLQGAVALAGAGLLLLGPMLAPLSAESKAYPALGAMFAFAAMQHVTDTLSSTLNIPLLAREKFGVLARFDSFLPMVFTTMMVLAVFVFRTPLALTIGTAAESLAGFVLKVALYRRTEPREALRPTFEPALAREVFGVGWRVYITNLSARIGATADRLIVEAVLGPAALTIYNTACRLPQIVLETLTRLSEAITPNMTAVAAHEPERFPALLRRNALVVATVASAGIVAAGGLGTPLVQALFRRTDASVGTVVLLMSLYYGMEQHYSTLTRGFFAQNRIVWMIPFTFWNTVVKLLLTAPVARSAGLAGVAALSLFIDLVQFVPIHWITVRIVARGVPLGPLLGRSAAILGTGFAVALGFFLVTRGVPVGLASYAWVPLAWLPGAITLALLLGTGAGLMPDAVWEKLPGRLRRFQRQN